MTNERLTLNVIPETLTDGSIVWNVRIGNLTLHAYNKKNAWDLAYKLTSAIDEHTIDGTPIVLEVAA